MSDKIGRNISQIADYDECVMYSSVCACLDSDHNSTLILEYDTEMRNITLGIYQKIEPKDYYFNENVFKRLFRRINYAIKLLFGLPISFEGFHLFAGKEHIEDYIKALNQGLEKIKNGSV